VILDVEDPISGSYALEVSSPGLDRPLVKPEDYRRFAGRRVRLKTFGPIEGRRNFSGRLDGLDGEAVRLTLEDQRGISIPLGQVAKARLEADLGPGFKPAH
jgi:ribosome maturation factor RimP